jgi:hypothetical protein
VEGETTKQFELELTITGNSPEWHEDQACDTRVPSLDVPRFRRPLRKAGGTFPKVRRSRRQPPISPPALTRG